RVSQRRGYRNGRTFSSCALLSAGRYRLDSCRRAIMRVSLGHGGLHFRHRDHRQESDEKQEQRSENSERPNVCPDVDPRRDKQAPRGWKKIPVQSTGDNDKALEPHPGVDAHGDEKHDKDIAAAPSKPEKLW